MAAIQLLNYVLEGQAQVLSLPQPCRLFRRQTRLSGRGPARGVFLLRLNRLAFPAPGHELIIARPQYFVAEWSPRTSAERSINPSRDGILLQKTNF